MSTSCIMKWHCVQARGKKDAKQLAAAALVEILLETVPFQDLLHKSEKHQLKEMRAVRGSAMSSLCLDCSTLSVSFGVWPSALGLMECGL